MASVDALSIALERALAPLRQELSVLNATLARLTLRLQEPQAGRRAGLPALPAGAVVESTAPAVRRIEAVPAASTDLNCLVAGCTAPVLAKQLCETHYRIMRRTVAAGLEFDPSDQRPARVREASKTCREPGCTEAHYAKGLCRRHYMTARSRIRAAGRQDKPDGYAEIDAELPLEAEDDMHEDVSESAPAPASGFGNGSRDPVLAVPLFTEAPTESENNETLPTAEMVSRVVAQYRGGLDRVAEVLGRNKRTLMDLLHRLDLVEFVTRIRDSERQRIQNAPLRERLDDLLFREKLLDDLGCLKEVDRMTQFEVKMRCQELAKSSETVEEVLQRLGTVLELDDAGMKRLIWRYDLRRHLRGLKLKAAQPPMRTRA